jgi:CHAD domain-containing protein
MSVPGSKLPASAEREVKLGAAPSFHLPEFGDLAEGVVAGPEQEARLETTYYDTADLRLARWGLSLRHRGGEGWTLKLPGSSDGTLLTRGELTFSGPARRPPPDAVTLVRAYLRGAPLEAVARLSTWRRRVALQDEAGRALAEVVDDEVSVIHGRRVAARFREVEVELRPGGDPLLPRLLERLRRAGAGRPDPTPKYVRALGPAALAEPDVAVRHLDPGAATADVVRNALAAGVVLVLSHDPLIRLGGDPEDIHQARVGTRRLRSHLRTFRPFLDRAWTDSLRDELGWLAAELGAVRDYEVLLERVEALAPRLAAADAKPLAGLTGQLEKAIAGCRDRLLAAMSSPRYYELIERLVAASEQPPLNEEAADRMAAPAAEAMPALVIKPWRDLRRAARALGERPPDEDLHRVRILAKRVRYAAEAVAPAVGPQASRFAKLAAALQTELGEHQDSVTARSWLRQAARSTRRAFVAGQLYALEAARGEESRGRWPDAWLAIDRRRARAWMTPERMKTRARGST